MEETSIQLTPEQWVEHYKKNYCRTLTLDIATRIIKSDMMNMARTCVSIGFHLKAVRDMELFKESGYENIWDYAADQFGLSMSSASRYMAINDQFSVGGNTPQLQEEYRNFSKSQLQEMITMSDEQKKQVTEKMTVKQIRQIKNPEPETPEEPGQEEEQIQGQMNIEEYEDVLPDKPVATSQNTGKCLHRPDFQCTLPEEDKRKDGDGNDCSHSCCWNCIKHGDCKLECSSSADRPDQENSEDEEEKVEPLSVYGLPLRTYPPESLIATSGCGTHDCFSCHIDGCQIRQEDCYCMGAPLGNPFPCLTLNVVENIREEVGDRCQFVNHDLAFHRPGDGEPVPCCGECEDPCGYECNRSSKARWEKKKAQIEETGAAEEQQEPDVIQEEVQTEEKVDDRYEETTDLTDLEIAQNELDKANRFLNDLTEVFTDSDRRVRKQKLIVAALAGLVCDLDLVENPPEEPEQPELPVMKNNDQRKEWLRNYKDWGLWYEDEHIGAKYYKFDFSNGARLIAEEYECLNSYVGEYTTSYLHLVGGPEPPKHSSHGIGKWKRNERYNRHASNETELVEFLKFVQKGVES